MENLSAAAVWTPEYGRHVMKEDDHDRMSIYMFIYFFSAQWSQFGSHLGAASCFVTAEDLSSVDLPSRGH